MELVEVSRGVGGVGGVGGINLVISGGVLVTAAYVGILVAVPRHTPHDLLHQLPTPLPVQREIHRLAPYHQNPTLLPPLPKRPLVLPHHHPLRVPRPPVLPPRARVLPVAVERTEVRVEDLRVEEWS